jgi:hypothetical protein
VIHTGVEESQHDLFFHEGQPVETSLRPATEDIVLNGLAGLVKYNFFFHLLEDAASGLPLNLKPSLLHSFLEFFISVGEHAQHDIDALLVCELLILVEAEDLLLFHNVEKMLVEDVEAAFNVCVDVVANVESLDLLPVVLVLF